eukprot:CAMPEP_0118634582 /NCGR_PEP_ID=MMETSP0785-20121206/1623_1 /TAXON_ID=91992 /ORGANISM="Bolidomonas pacifica, Strain CCMP 1866" /LENGTH=155 /DNA_ID=CAMNT_0006525565 /DNA_START=60 /DNA_END=523 /DNA_ORIENTATION=-
MPPLTKTVLILALSMTQLSNSLLNPPSHAFKPHNSPSFQFSSSIRSSKILLNCATTSSSSSTTQDYTLDTNYGSQFTVKVCTGTKCARNGGSSNLESLFSSLAADGVDVEEASCLGWCKRGPCVSVEHEEYEGRIGLEGMRDSEGAQRMFFGIFG